MNSKSKRLKYTMWSNLEFLLEKYWLYNKWAFIFMVVMVPITLAIQFLNIYLPKVIVEQIELGHSFEKIIVSIGIIMIVRMFMTLIADILAHKNKCNLEEVQYGITEAVVNKGLTIHYEKLESQQYQNLLKQASYCTENWGGRVQIFSFPENIVKLVQNVLGYILFGTLISVVNPLIAVILTLTPFIPYYFTKKYQQYEYQNREQWTWIDRVQWYIGSNAGSFSYGKDIRAYHMKDWLCGTYQAMSKKRMYWDRQLLLRGGNIDFANLGIILLRDGLAYVILTKMVLSGEIALSTFVMLFAAVSSFSERINELLSNWSQLQSDHLRICDLHEFLASDTKQESNNGEQQQTAQKRGVSSPLCEIQVKNLTYRYEGASSDALHNINLEIRPGEKIAIVGWNGAGKTTLIKNICGLYHPTQGEVHLNGTLSTAYAPNGYYDYFGCIFQDVNLLPYSIAEFIATTIDQEVDRDRVQQSIALAGLTSKIERLPHGIDTKLNKQLNEEGIELSGGEKQKLLLARAIYHDAPILILDEPTAAMDPIAEHEIYLKYDEITKNKTSIFISHRLASTKFCDRILLMENGRIIEEGSHEMLMAQGGKYYELFTIQSKHYHTPTSQTEMMGGK